MRQPSELASVPHRLSLGIPGFEFRDLYEADGLRRLSERFEAQLAADAPSVAESLSALRARGGKGSSTAETSDLLIQVAQHLSRFLVRLFQIAPAGERLERALTAELPLFEFRRDFIA